MLRRIARAWKGYWLAPGGRHATAAIRIAIAVSLLWMLWRYATDWQHHSSRYNKLGPWLLFPGRPGESLLDTITIIAWGSTLAMLAGVWSRAAHAVSFVACTLIAAHGVSENPTWSHIDVPPLLASFAFLGAPGGAAFSIDAWRRRRLGEPPLATRQTSARLVLATVVSVFFIAGYWKLRADDGVGLGWALSDNLRHQILVRFDWIGLPRTPLADWIIAESWRYRTVAALNLVSQILPIAAVVLHRRPRLRACLGVLFVLEIVGLALVMDLWDLHWIPLAAVFIDWDAIVAWWRRRAHPTRTTSVEPEPLTRTRVHLAFATVFLLVYGLHLFWLNQRTRLFPLTSFPMFSEVRAKKPYSEHQSYELLGGHIELLGDRPMRPDEVSWVDAHGGYRWMFRTRDPVRLRAHLHAILDELSRAWPDLGIRTVRLSLAVFQAPAYPAPAALARTDVAILGELDADGTFRTRLHQIGAPGMRMVVTPRIGAMSFVALEAADGARWLVR
ncbi:MAG: hypothetical protein ACKV2T_40275 [Kofleriaceae bacterium]